MLCNYVGHWTCEVKEFKLVMTHYTAQKTTPIPVLSDLRENEFAGNNEAVSSQIPELPRNKILQLTEDWPYPTLGKNTGESSIYWLCGLKSVIASQISL